MGNEVLIWVAIGSLLSLGLLFWCFRCLRRKRLIENVPTSKVNGVFMGLNEVKGRARSEIPLVSYLAEARCVYYEWSITEQYRRTETYTDSKGNSRTRTVSGWNTVASDKELAPFLIEDSTGRLRIDPQGAKIDAHKILATTCGRGNSLYFFKGPRRAISNSTHRRTFTERAIRLGDAIYVMGMARFNDSLNAPEIREDRQAELFLISVKDERAITRGLAWRAFFTLLFGTTFAFLTPVGFGMPESMTFADALRGQLTPALLTAAGYLAAVGIYYLTLVYNGLVSVRERAEMAWSMIDVQLRRRNTLVPRLVACVKGYADYEQETHRGVAEQRTVSALRQIIAIAEDYPDLKADKNYLALQVELVNTEDKIALAREFYNGTVKAYNDRLGTLPDALVAGPGRFKKRDYFAAHGFERAVPNTET